MAYYSNGTRLDTSISIAKHTAGAINARFKGMNVLTTLDALPITAGFEAYTSYEMTGYKWGGTQIKHVALASLKRNINNCSSVTKASINGTTFSNTLSYPKVYYVMFQAAGGGGGNSSGPANPGGGSGYYTLSKVVLQPGSSFKVTHSTTKATITLVTGAAYMNGAIRAAGYSFSITATAGDPGTILKAGAGFRSGGKGRQNGAGIAVNELSYDGYTCPAHAISGGTCGQDRVSAPATVESIRGGGGGGASAGPYLRNYGGTMRTGGGGAFYFKDTYNTYSQTAQAGIFGGGGGGGEYSNPGAAGGPAESLIFY